MLQSIIIGFLRDNGVKCKKYLKYIRIDCLNTYINIYTEDQIVKIRLGSMAHGIDYVLSGKVGDPSNIVLNNLLKFCRSATALQQSLLDICEGGRYARD